MLLHSVLAAIHVLAGATWLGSMFFSFFVFQPRARAYFEKEADLESFILTVSHGARWKVLLALGVIAVTGAGLVVVRWPHPMYLVWLALVGAKVLLFAAALCLFVYTSWRLWPARLFASADELPRLRKVFQRVAVTMISLAALSMVLGILLHTG